MPFLALLLWTFTAIAGDGIYNAKCKKNDDCIGHLICKKKKCVAPNSPTKEKCATFSFRQTTKKGDLIASCPPDCGFKEDLIYGPTCVLNQTGCAASIECRESGLCEFNGEACVRSEEGCAKSARCKLNGLCGFDGEQCVPNVQGCADSIACTQEGRCGYVPGPQGYQASHGRCKITAKGCVKSALCKSVGKCGFEGDICISTKMGCANSIQCKKDGKCRQQKYIGCVK